MAGAWLVERDRSAADAAELRFDAIGVTIDARRARWSRLEHLEERVLNLPRWRAAVAAVERELLVGDRLERQPVQRRDAEPLDRRAVLGRRVADVGGELPAGMARVGAAHVAVARDLGDDRGGGDRGARGVAADRRRAARSRVADREAVAQADAARARDARERVAQRGEVRARAGRGRRSRARSATTTATCAAVRRTSG